MVVEIGEQILIDHADMPAGQVREIIHPSAHQRLMHRAQLVRLQQVEQFRQLLLALFYRVQAEFQGIQPGMVAYPAPWSLKVRRAR